MSHTDITGADRARLLKALYDHARALDPQALASPDGTLPFDLAATELASRPDRRFDALHGKSLGVDLSADQLSLEEYDRRNDGEGGYALLAAGLAEQAGLCYPDLGGRMDVRRGIEARYREDVADALMRALATTYFNPDRYDCADNLRIADQDDHTDVAEYERRRGRGCCGFFDATITVAGRTYGYGFNYGH